MFSSKSIFVPKVKVWMFFSEAAGLLVCWSTWGNSGLNWGLDNTGKENARKMGQTGNWDPLGPSQIRKSLERCQTDSLVIICILIFVVFRQKNSVRLIIWLETTQTVNYYHMVKTYYYKLTVLSFIVLLDFILLGCFILEKVKSDNSKGADALMSPLLFLTLRSSAPRSEYELLFPGIKETTAENHTAVETSCEQIQIDHQLHYYHPTSLTLTFCNL